MLAPFALVSFVVSALAGARLGAAAAARGLVAGMLVIAAGMLVTRAMIGRGRRLARAAGRAWLLTGAGVGLANPLVTFAHLGVLPPAQGGLASALNNTARQIGLAIGIAVLGALLEASLDGGDRAQAYADGVGELLLISAGLAWRRRGGLRARPPGATCGRQRAHPCGEPSASPPGVACRRAARRRRHDRLPHGRRAVPDRDRGRARSSRAPPWPSGARGRCADPDAERGAAAAVPRAARARRHVRRLPRPARRRRRGARRAVLAQGRVLDGLRARDDRAGRVGRRVGPGRGARRRRASSWRSTSRRGASARACGCAGGAIAAVAFRNVPAYVLARGVPGQARGRLEVDVSYGGAIYASLPARAAGLAVDAGALRRADRARARDQVGARRHRASRAIPTDDRLSGIYGTILYDELGDRVGPHQRNVAVFADGEVDRSPCGSGTSARVALLAADGRMPPGAVLTPRLDRRHHVHARGSSSPSDADGVVTEVEGMAYRTGEHRFVLDPRDPLGDGVRAAVSLAPFLDAARRALPPERGRRRARGGAARRARPRGRPAALARRRPAAAHALRAGGLGVKLVTVGDAEPRDPGRLRALRRRDARAGRAARRHRA